MVEQGREGLATAVGCDLVAVVARILPLQLELDRVGDPLGSFAEACIGILLSRAADHEPDQRALVAGVPDAIDHDLTGVTDLFAAHRWCWAGRRRDEQEVSGGLLLSSQRRLLSSIVLSLGQR